MNDQRVRHDAVLDTERRFTEAAGEFHRMRRRTRRYHRTPASSNGR